ncbi:MAG TPA: type II toxin-antitoxin system antitoxin, RelB/DinJ family [Firmicutes bacterium]|nr:type II toxin-antitoxin system antitoxin, RelB/DinJ family [Bacillota bacterium]
MAMTNLNIRVDETVKEQSEKIFNELGLNMTTAINMFLRASIRENGVTLNLRLDTPNKETASAIEEGRRFLADPSASRYSNMDELKKALEK